MSSDEPEPFATSNMPPSATRATNIPVEHLAGELPEVFGRYRIKERLGKGGMGAVFLAHDTELDRPVAIKVPIFSAHDSSDVLDRFRREARAAATLTHPNLCPVYDVGAIDGIHFIAMAYIEGKSLAARLHGGVLLPQDAVAAFIRQLAVALEEAHRKGVVHRDLKPANIMINERQEPIIMDFGLARRLHKQDERLTAAGAIIGTPAYMSPEQVEHSSDIGPSTDIYSLGVIMYELLTGKLPFHGSAAAILGRIMVETPARPSQLRPELDPALEAICLKAMARKIADRYATMDEFAQALTGYLERQPAATGNTAAASDSKTAQAISQLAREFVAALAAPRSDVTEKLWRESDSRAPSHVGVWIAAALAFVAVLGVIYLIAFRKEQPQVVVVRLEVHGLDLKRPGLAVFIDGKPIVPPEKLAEPLSLPAGVHRLVVQQDGKEIDVREFKVEVSQDQTVVAVPPARAIDSGPPVPMPPETRKLADELRSKDQKVRKQAAEAMGKLGDKSAAPALAERVADDVWYEKHFQSISDTSDPEGGGKGAALAALQKLAPERVTAALTGGLKSKTRQVRDWCAVEIGKRTDAAAVPALIERVRDDVWFVGHHQAIPPEPNDPIGGGKGSALAALRKLANGRVVETLTPCLKSSNPAMRLWAAEEMGKQKDAAAAPALVARVADDVWHAGRPMGIPPDAGDPATGGKAAALQALRALAPERVAEALKTAAASKNKNVSSWATVELGKLMN
ncbi:MAG: protein kinase [Gemmataceae bacterium]